MAKKDGFKGGKVLRKQVGDQIHVGPITIEIEQISKANVAVRVVAPSEFKITTTDRQVEHQGSNT